MKPCNGLGAEAQSFPFMQHCSSHCAPKGSELHLPWAVELSEGG